MGLRYIRILLKYLSSIPCHGFPSSPDPDGQTPRHLIRPFRSRVEAKGREGRRGGGGERRSKGRKEAISAVLVGKRETEKEGLRISPSQSQT
jgi:hypothetical protein